MFRKKQKYNKNDILLFILVASLAAGSMSGVWQLPRTFSLLFLLDFLSKINLKRSFAKPITFLIAWACYAAVSLVWTSDFGNGLIEGALLICNILLFSEILLYAAKAREPVKTISTGWFFALIVTSVIGIWEIFTNNHLATSKTGDYAQMVSEGQLVMHNYATATFFNYNSYVVFICYCLPFLLYLYFSSNGIYKKVLYVSSLIVAIFILFMNASRGGIIALIIIISVFAYPMLKKGGSFKTILVLAVILVVALISLWDEISLYVMIRTQEVGSFEDEARYDIWMRALRCFFPTLGFGTGVGSIAASMQAISSSGDVIVPHNALLELLVQFGLIISVVCLLFFFKIFKRGMTLVVNCEKSLVLSCVISFPFVMIIDSSYLATPAIWAFWASLYMISILGVKVK